MGFESNLQHFLLELDVVPWVFHGEIMFSIHNLPCFLLTDAKRREFSGMIHNSKLSISSSQQPIQQPVQQPYVKSAPGRWNFQYCIEALWDTLACLRGPSVGVPSRNRRQDLRGFWWELMGFQWDFTRFWWDLMGMKTVGTDDNGERNHLII